MFDAALPAGSFTEHRAQDTGRPYWLAVPPGYDGRPTALLVMLHGCNQTPEDSAAGTRMNRCAGALGWLVAWPAQTAAANAQRCWNWFNRKNQDRGRGEAGEIAGVTQEVMQTHAVDARRVFVAGLSAGGAAAAIMGQAYPDLYAAIGVHSGLACGAAFDLSSALAAMHSGGSPADRMGGAAVPTIIFQGDQDRTVHPLNSRFVAAQSGRGALLRRQTQRVPAPGYDCTRILYRDGRGRVLIEEWLVHGGGHAWFGGDPAGSYADPAGPDATREMLRFFVEHGRDVPGGV